MASLLGDSGPLAGTIEGFTARPQQQRMATAVAAAIAGRRNLVVEAGTGTGKTYAYLVPVLMSGARTLISTHTKNLQDQLFHRDLPRVRAALGVPVRTALLKGRANYLCRYRLDRALAQPESGASYKRLRAIEAWARQTADGDLAEVGIGGESDPLQPRVSSTAENCLGSRCPDFEACFVVKARRAAQGADVVVVNHSLLLADLSLKDAGFGEVLPGAQAIVIDEAHRLPELVTQFLSLRLSTRQIEELAQDCAQVLLEYPDLAELRPALAQLADAADHFAALFGPSGERVALDAFLSRPDAAQRATALRQALRQVADTLGGQRERSSGVATLADRVEDASVRLHAILTERDEDSVRWAEAARRGGSVLSTPVLAGPGFRRFVDDHPGAWIFTSATLSTGGDFTHFCSELGLASPTGLTLDSPFDFARQARLYLPPGLPEPNEPDFTDRVIDEALPVITAAGGGVFLLCTSYRALRRAAVRLRAALALPLFVQGEGSRADLLDGFARAGNGVLIGVASFWQGVDVKGQALRVVIVDRLPFAAPGDPVLEARLAALRRNGADPFMDYQVPQAITTLRQGVGRLIRDAHDHGLLMICDPRVRTRGYGARMLASLPPMPILETRSDALAWLATVERPA